VFFNKVMYFEIRNMQEVQWVWGWETPANTRKNCYALLLFELGWYEDVPVLHGLEDSYIFSQFKLRLCCALEGCLYSVRDSLPKDFHLFSTRGWKNISSHKRDLFSE